MMPTMRTILPALALFGASATGAPAAGFPWPTYADRPAAWYRGEEAFRLAENILSHQTDQGDWPKNLDTSSEPYRGDRTRLRGTFDNGATVGEMRFLARAFVMTGREPYGKAFIRALDHLLSAQYPCGGWPQSDPPGKGYARYITFNDNTMVNLLELVRDLAECDDFSFVDRARRDAANHAFAAGIDCILRCQVRVNGELTAWCAQHDPITFQPKGARTFELPSISGGESEGILLLLMSLDDPSPEVVQAICSGVRWYERSRVTGIRQVVVNGDKKIVHDPIAPPLWARFYEIESNRPFFCGRDGVKKYELDRIEFERRNGYAWYGDWGRRVLDRFAIWDKNHAAHRRETGKR